MIKVNNALIKTPSEYTVSLEDIVNAERNTLGTMVIERVATKRKLELSWNVLTQAELASILQAVSAVTFTVEYPDPEDGTLKTGTFYSGSKSAGAIDYRGGTIRWKDAKMNWIEI